MGQEYSTEKRGRLTDCPHIRQTKAKMAKSRNFVKLGCVFQLIGRIDHAKYFWYGMKDFRIGNGVNGVKKDNFC